MKDNIYDALRESHERQRTLCRKLLRSKPDEPMRRALFRELRIELAAHAAAEERYLYAPILMDDAGLNSSRHALAEHHQMDECVEDMTGLNPTGRRWMARAHKLSEKVHHHLKEEEKKFFQVSGKILSATQKARLAGSYRRDYTRMFRSLSQE